MEWCVHIAGEGDLQGDVTLERLSALNGSARLHPAVESARDEIARRFGDVTFSRCAFGNEFCERLIPPESALDAVFFRARDQGLAFTFLTPYVSNGGLSALRPLLALLERSGGCEVVFNDWGVLNVLRREFPRLTPVQGRLLNKSLRDPRVMGVYAGTQPATPAALATLDALRRSNLDCEGYTSLLARLGVAAVAMDNLPQGMDVDFARRGVAVAVHLPFGFISTSRVCMAAALHYRKHDKFQPGAPCRHECQTHLVEYTYTNSPFNNRDQRFYLKGNTYFYSHTTQMFETLFEQAQGGVVSRLVFEPRLPMLWSCQ